MSTLIDHGGNTQAKDAAPPQIPAAGHFSDLVREHAHSDNLPAADWITVLKLSRPREDVRSLSEMTRFTKRVMDIVVSTVMLVLLAPVMLGVAILVRLTSPGPIIFRQERVGLNLRTRWKNDRRTPPPNGPPEGQAERRRAETDRRTGGCTYGMVFTLYKFRTMRVDAEKQGARFAEVNDPRVTPIGAFPRKTRLDELPQLWNVLRGEMSLVGPRPERPVFIKQLSEQIPGYVDRLGLKPGLTGIAQVVNGYDSDIESFRRKVALDLLYLQNCCFWNDVKILIRTVRVVLTGFGAR